MGCQDFFFEILMITLISSKNLGGDRNMNNTVLAMTNYQNRFDFCLKAF